MHTIMKGNRFERFAKNYYLNKGCFILFKAIHIRYHANDFAGLFDIVAYDKNTKQFIFVSVKSYKPKREHIEDIRSFSTTFGAHNICEIFYYEKKEFYVIRIVNGVDVVIHLNKEDVLDEKISPVTSPEGSKIEGEIIQYTK